MKATPAFPSITVCLLASAAFGQTTTRVARCEPWHPGTPDACATLPASGTRTLLNYAGGPGNIDSIQLALTGLAAAPVGIMTSSLKVYIDGSPAPALDTDLGTFYMSHGAGPAFTGNNISMPFMDYAAGAWGGNRKIWIPWTTSIRVDLVNSTAKPANIFSQILYRAGTPTWIGLNPAYHKVFHSSTTKCCTTSDWLTTANILPLRTVCGNGVLDSITWYSHNNGAGASGSSASDAETRAQPKWLEGNPKITIDSGQSTQNIIEYGGTEDFFHNQFYFWQTAPMTDEAGGRKFNVGNTTHINAYRYFNESPVTFNDSIQIEFPVGSLQTDPTKTQGKGPDPVSIGWSALVIWYTDI